MLTKKQGNYAILSKTFCVQKECVFAKPPFLMDSGLQKKMGNGACWWAIVCALGTGKYFSLSCVLLMTPSCLHARTPKASGTSLSGLAPGGNKTRDNTNAT